MCSYRSCKPLNPALGRENFCTYDENDCITYVPVYLRGMLYCDRGRSEAFSSAYHNMRFCPNLVGLGLFYSRSEHRQPGRVRW